VAQVACGALHLNVISDWDVTLAFIMVEVEFIVVTDTGQGEQAWWRLPAHSESILAKLINLRSDWKAWLRYLSLRIELRLAKGTPSNQILSTYSVVNWIKHLETVRVFEENIHSNAATELCVCINWVCISNKFG
jgi:hypothetical protein